MQALTKKRTRKQRLSTHSLYDMVNLYSAPILKIRAKFNEPTKLQIQIGYLFRKVARIRSILLQTDRKAWIKGKVCRNFSV